MQCMNAGGIHIPRTFHEAMRAITPYLTLTMELEQTQDTRKIQQLKGIMSSDTSFFVRERQGKAGLW